MITRLKFILILFFIILNQNLFCENLNLTKEEKQWIKDNPSIKVAMPIDYKPFSFKMDGLAMGLDFDLLNLIEEKTSLKFEKIQNSWGESVHNFKSKKVDMITSFGRKKDKDNFAFFTEAYYTSNLVLKIYGKKAQKLNINESWAKNFANKKIGIIKNISFKPYLKDKSIVSLYDFNSKLELLKALSNDKIDFIIVNTDLHKNKKEQFKDIIKYNEIELTDVRKSSQYIGVIKDKEILYSIIQKALNSISKEQIESLHKKWKNTLAKKTEIKLSQEEINYLKNKKEIKICVAPSWIPFEQITKDNKHIGISADILKLISKKLEKEFTLLTTKTWKESTQNLKNFKCDILPMAMKTSSRIENMNFTKAYVSEPVVVATKLDEIYIRDKEQLFNKKIAIVENSALIESIRLENLPIKIVAVKDAKEGLEKIRSKKVFAFMGTIPAIAYNIQKYGFVDLKIAGQLEDSIDLSMASRIDEPLLNSILQKALNTISKEEIRKIVGQWIKIKVQQEFDYKSFFYIFSIFTVIILTVLYKNRVMKQKVKEAVEKNQEQERLIFFQSKLATMGETINIIAHQWRQPISTISNHLTNMQLKIEYKKQYEEKELLDCILKAQDGLKYISSTISLFQSYLSQKASLDKGVFELNDTLNRTLKLYEAILKKYKISIDIDVPKYIKIKGKQDYLIQILMVLLNNSKEAILENKIEKALIKIYAFEENKKLVLCFEDNAKGIQTKENIFDPYISNKNSTGLGLFIAKNIMNKIFKGQIEFENTKDGAKFTMHFLI